MTQDDLITAVAEETGFYKKDILTVLQSLENQILDNMRYEEIKLFKGVYFGTEETKRKVKVDPYGRDIVIKPYLKSYVRYTDTFREQFRDKE